MIENEIFDYTIIGGGISGCILYYRLKSIGLKVLLLNGQSELASSKVAAGLLNPIVFKRLTKSWEVDLLLQELTPFYQELEKKFGEKLFYQKEIVKILANEDERKFWQKKAKMGIEKYIEEQVFFENEDKINNYSGLSIIKNSGFLNIGLLIHTIIEYASQNNEFLNTNIDYNDIMEVQNNNVKGEVSYYQIECNKRIIKTNNIIFAEGHRGTKNPFFPNAQFKLTKGEVLILEIPGLKLNYVLNKGVFLLPIRLIDNTAQDLFVCGATYRWENLDELPTEDAKDEILKKLEVFLKIPYKVIGHKVGIRPTVIDRRPILAKKDKLFFFNGMGTKAVMITPLLSKLFIKSLVFNQDINNDEKRILDVSDYARFL